MSVTFDPANKSANITLSNGNLTAETSGASWCKVRATEGKTSGKWYWEATIANSDTLVGIMSLAADFSGYIGDDATGYGYFADGKTYFNGNDIGVTSYSAGDVLSFALDLDNGKIWFGKNGTWIAGGTPDPATGADPNYSGLAATTWFAGSTFQNNGKLTVNFGASAFSYTIPTGFSAYDNHSFDISTCSNITVVIDHSKIDSTLTDFPVAIDLDDVAPALVEALGANPLKLAVYSGSTELLVEIECWETGNHVIHTKVPSISASAGTELTLYYDATQSDNSDYVGVTGSAPAQTVWDSEFAAVYHMAQDPSGGAGCIKDSTVNAKHGTTYGTMTAGDLIDGQLGKAINFDGSDDYLDLGVPYEWNSGEFTLDLSCKNEVDDSEFHIFIDNATPDNYNNRFYLYLNQASGKVFTYARVTSSTSISGEDSLCGDLSIITAQRTASEIRTWNSGHVDSTLNFSGDCSQGHPLTIGGSAWGYYTRIQISEFRVSFIARSDAWIKATNANLKKELVYLAQTPITGTVKELGVPVAWPVRLYSRDTGELVETQISDADDDGSFSFSPRGDSHSYYIVALDPSMEAEYAGQFSDLLKYVFPDEE